MVRPNRQAGKNGLVQKWGWPVGDIIRKYALLDDFGHASVPGQPVVADMEFFKHDKPSTCKAGSNDVSYVYVRPPVQT